MYLSVIIPAYNEEKRIEKTLLSVHEYLSRQSYEHEIIVVSDGSTDRTAEVVSNLKFKIENLKLIDEGVNRGKGWVVRRGMLAAQGDYRLFMDADNSTIIDHLDKFWPYMAEPSGFRPFIRNANYDIVIASIGLKGADIAHTEKFYKRFLGKLGNLWIRFWVVPGIHDTQRGFKLFTAQAAEAIFPKLRITRWGFDIEVLALARKFGFKIKEIAIRWKNDADSKVKPFAYLQVLIETLKIRWNLWSGKYKNA